MLIGQRFFVTAELNIKVCVIVHIKSILLKEEEGIQTSVADVRRPSLVVKVYRSIDQTDYLEVFHPEILKLVLVIFVRDFYMVSYVESFVSDAVRVHHAFVRILRQPAFSHIESV